MLPRRTWTSLGLLVAVAAESAANPPPEPEPEPGCAPEQLERIALFPCPAETTRVVACPRDQIE